MSYDFNDHADEARKRREAENKPLMLPLLREFKQLVPVIFDDLEAK